MNQRTIEIIVGLFIAAGLLAFFVLAMKVSNIGTYSDENGYELKARFENIGGLKVRSPVTLAGVRIGRVSHIGIDHATQEAVVTLNINPEYQLSADTFANIFTAGLLGEQYIGLEPGGDSKVLGPGDEIKQTQSALVLEKLISQFLFSKAEGGEKSQNE
jgi:phospholipid/cholesterol/gamma-HCH transport system substrate-binding protein